MCKKSKKVQSHHLYLGAGGMLALAALVISLTFGLASAQMDGGNYTSPPDGGTSTPPPSTSTPPPSTSTPPPSTYTPPPTGTCPPGETGTPPNCSGVTTPPPSTYTSPPTGGTCSGTAITCTSGASYCENGAWRCPTTTTTPPPTGGTCPGTAITCTSGASYCENGIWKCPTTGTTTTPPVTCVQPAGGCPNGVTFNYSTCTCPTGTTTTPPPTTGTKVCGQSSCSTNSSAPRWCDGVTTTFDPRDCGCARNEPCRLGSTTGTTPPPTTTTPPPTSTCIQPAGGCPNGATFDSSTCTCRTGTTGTQPPSTGNYIVCPDGYRAAPGEPCPWSAPQTQQDQEKTCANGTKMPAWQMCPGECPSDMLSCPDYAMLQWNPQSTNTVCMPKYDWQTRAALTCEDHKARTMAPPQGMMGTMPGMMGQGMTGQGMMGQGMMGQGMMGQGMTGMQQPMNDPRMMCQYNPNDPFCKSGETGIDYGMQYEFNDEKLDQYKQNFSGQDVRRAMGDLRRELPHLKQVCEEVKFRVEEVQRQVAGLAIPVIAEVKAIGDQFCAVAAKVETLSPDTPVEVVEALAAEVSATHDLDKILYGEGPGKLGKIAGLDIAREIGFINQRVQEEYGFISRDIARMKEAGLDPKVVEKAEAILAKIAIRKNDILAPLRESGKTFAQLVEENMNFHPAKKCAEWGIYDFGPGGPGGPGPFPGPIMPMQGSGGMDMGGFDMGMMEKMQQKMMEIQSGSGGFGMGGSMGGSMGGMGGSMGGMGGTGGSNIPGPGMMPQGSPYGTSTLTAQSGSSMGGPGFGPPNFGPDPDMGPPPADCLPPVQRILGIEDFLRELDEVMRSANRLFEKGNKCQMFKLGLEQLEENIQGVRRGPGPPPEAAELLRTGVAACETGNTADVEKVAAKLFRMMQKGQGMGDIFDTEDFAKDKIQDKLRQKYGLDQEFDKSGLDEDVLARIQALEEQLATVTAKFEKVVKTLNEVTQAVMAVSEKMADLGTKIAVFEDANLTAVLDNAARVLNEERRDTIIGRANDVTDKLETLRSYVEDEDTQELIDKAAEVIAKSPPSETGTENIVKILTLTVNNCANATDADHCIEAVENDIATTLALNTDIEAKVADGSIPSADITDNSVWYAPHFMNGLDTEVTARGEDGKLNPANPETKEAVAVRACRLGGIDFKEVHSATEAVPTATENVSPWASGCISELEQRGIEIPEGEGNVPASRGETAFIYQQVLEDQLAPEDKPRDLPLPSDVPATHPYAEAIDFVRDFGIMTSVDGKETSPFGVNNALDRAQGVVTAVGIRNLIVEE